MSVIFNVLFNESYFLSLVFIALLRHKKVFNLKKIFDKVSAEVMLLVMLMKEKRKILFFSLK